MLIENLFLIPIIIFLVGIINKFFLDAKKEFKPHLNSSRNKLIIKKRKKCEKQEKHKQKKDVRFFFFYLFLSFKKRFFRGIYFLFQ